MPRLFEEPESIPGLTWPDAHVQRPAHHRPRRRPRRPGAAVLRPRPHRGRHRRLAAAGSKMLFAGDLVEAAGRALHRRRVPPRLGRRHPRPGQGASAPRRWSAAAARSPRGRDGRRRRRSSRPATSCDVMHRTRSAPCTRARRHAQGGLRRHPRRARADSTARWPIFEHCLPFDVSRLWDELRRHRPAGDLDRRARPRGLGRSCRAETMTSWPHEPGARRRRRAGRADDGAAAGPLGPAGRRARRPPRARPRRLARRSASSATSSTSGTRSASASRSPPRA